MYLVSLRRFVLGIKSVRRNDDHLNEALTLLAGQRFIYSKPNGVATQLEHLGLMSINEVDDREDALVLSRCSPDGDTSSWDILGIAN